MNTPAKPSTPEQQQAESERADAREQGKDLQPPTTGADGGSPAAAVMKQSAKTKAESSGRS